MGFARGAWIGVLAVLAVCQTGRAAPIHDFRDCTDVCPSMIVVGPGQFLMGRAQSPSDADDPEAKQVPESSRGDAMPQHSVVIHAFAIGQYDVTREEFAAFVAETGYQIAESCYGPNASRTDWDWTGKDWRNPGFPQTERDPVVCVSYDDARAYAAWLSGKTGRPYRLPSEAEWEFAARAGTTTSRFWGDDSARACQFANVADLVHMKALNKPLEPGTYFACSDGFAFTSPVGSFAPNAFGLYDMLGNVAQWTADCWNDSYTGAPTDERPWLTGDCGSHPGRGGMWNGIPYSTRVDFRGDGSTTFHGAHGGFRVARSLLPSEQ
jgi:sulfatase modifying factor 1